MSFSLSVAALLALSPVARFGKGQVGPIRAESATVVVNEVPILSLQTSLAGLTPDRRAEALAKRIGEITPGVRIWVKGQSTKKVVRRRRKRHVIEVPLPGRLLMGGDQVLLEVSPTEAKAQGSTPSEVAKKWAYELQAALALPPLKLSAKSLQIPLGGTGAVGLIGRAVAGAQVTTSDPNVAKIDRKTGTLVFTGGAVGTTTITIQGETGTETLSVRVQPYAASFPQYLNATVVGSPATADVVTDVVGGVVRTALSAQPERKLQIVVPTDVRVPVGESRTVTVKVKATAPDAFPAEGVAMVKVTNPGISNRDEAELWYCNEPENIKMPQSLFRGELLPEHPVRMLYHHINESPQTLYLAVDIHNPSDVPARVMLIPGDAPPDKNPVRAGLRAAEPFFQAWMTGSGEVVTIPPHSRLPLSFRRLGKSECGSGLAYLRLLPSGPERLVVQADARPATLLGEPWLTALNSATPWREVGTPALETNAAVGELSDLVFPRPFSDENVEYQVGGRFAFGRIGQKPIPRKTKGDPLQGNFGVIYRINCTAQNPTNKPTDVEVVFDASAGYSGALFVVDGVLRRLPLMQPKTEYQLARFRLAPGERKSVRLITIPLSGSSYPATVAVRPVDGIKATTSR